MKTIIAGGRNKVLSLAGRKSLDALPISEVVSGGSAGIDSEGETYAKNHKIPLTIFPAKWHIHGKAAGPIRNKEMADYADALILFSGGRGTDSMYDEAVKAKIKIYDFREGAENVESL